MSLPHITPMTWISAREVLPGEATDFTPWLAANLDLLGDALGIADLTALDTEVAVHDKRLDILAQGTDENGEPIPVIIENQYEKTNHDHLGKLVTYLAQQQHGVAVWVAEDISPAHLAAVEFLNRTSIEGVDYFLVRVRFTHGEQGHQVHFEIQAGPNRFLNAGKSPKPASKVNAGKKAFLEEVLHAIQTPLASIGLRGIRMHTNGSYITMRLPLGSGLDESGIVLLPRVTQNAISVVLRLSAFDSRDENYAGLEVVRRRYEAALHLALPGVEFEWHAGTIDKLADNAQCTLAGVGYVGGDPQQAAAWVEKVCTAWAAAAKADPIADLAAEVETWMSVHESTDLEVTE